MAERLVYQLTEFAQAMCLSKDTVKRQIDKGKIRSIRVGRRILIPVSEVQRLLGSDSASPDAFGQPNFAGIVRPQLNADSGGLMKATRDGTRAERQRKTRPEA